MTLATANGWRRCGPATTSTTVTTPLEAAAALGHDMTRRAPGWRCGSCGSALLADSRGPFGSALLRPCPGPTPDGA